MPGEEEDRERRSGEGGIEEDGVGISSQDLMMI
jgi:hypothetical protein